jgi:hypothetical protein
VIRALGGWFGSIPAHRFLASLNILTICATNRAFSACWTASIYPSENLYQSFGPAHQALFVELVLLIDLVQAHLCACANQ